MQVGEWGPAGWKFLHTITFNYTPTDDNIKQYKTFFNLQLQNTRWLPWVNH